MTMDRWQELFAETAFRRSADTAHDLKTPLNIAVLNLELLRMRLKKLLESEDQKVENYAQALETELRRLARIFDAFFLLSTPPKGEGEPVRVDLAGLCTEVASAHGYNVALDKPATAVGHESRIREALKMFFEGASTVLKEEGRRAEVSRNGRFMVTVSGRPAADEFEPTKVFKFYYTDQLGNPDLSLAAARLIAETYGGDLDVLEESDKVSLRLSFPLGDQ
jgi:nitrogen fixation/metabolism regulation signal transduction histidine kinase